MQSPSQRVRVCASDAEPQTHFKGALSEQVTRWPCDLTSGAGSRLPAIYSQGLWNFDLQTSVTPHRFPRVPVNTVPAAVLASAGGGGSGIEEALRSCERYCCSRDRDLEPSVRGRVMPCLMSLGPSKAEPGAEPRSALLALNS